LFRNEDIRLKAAKQLNTYVTGQVREMPPENFTKFLTDLNTRISTFVNNSSTIERAGAVLAIGNYI
jgi:hypothetical protein